MIQLYKRLSKHLTKFILNCLLILTRLTKIVSHSHKQSRTSLIRLIPLSKIRRRLRSNQRCNKTLKLGRLRTMNMPFQRSIITCFFNNQSNNSRSTLILPALVVMVDTIMDVNLTRNHQVIQRMSFIIASLAVLITAENAMHHMDTLTLWSKLSSKKSQSSRSTPITTVNGNVTPIYSRVANTEITRALMHLMMLHIAADNAISIYAASVSKPSRPDEIHLINGLQTNHLLKSLLIYFRKIKDSFLNIN